jgi:hypothetical protein
MAGHGGRARTLRTSDSQLCPARVSKTAVRLSYEQTARVEISLLKYSGGQRSEGGQPPSSQKLRALARAASCPHVHRNRPATTGKAIGTYYRDGSQSDRGFSRVSVAK